MAKAVDVCTIIGVSFVKTCDEDVVSKIAPLSNEQKDTNLQLEVIF